MFWGKNRKTVKELRRNHGMTARELAIHVKVDTVKILKIDDLELRKVEEPLKTKITPVLTGKR